MKLYKYMSAKCAYYYLHNGEVEVEKYDAQKGIISFSMKTWSGPSLMISDGVVLEIDEPENRILSRRDNSYKVLQVNLSSCKLVGTSYFYKINPDFRLDSFTIGPDCQINWRYVRSCLKKNGKGNSGITLLMIDANSGMLYRDEEYRTDNHGLYCLKHNPKHPSIRDKTYVKDVVLDCSGIESLLEPNK